MAWIWFGITTNNDEIAYLRKRKLVEGRKNALYFAKRVAGATGQKAVYTRIKGFDDEYYKDLILWVTQ